MTRQIDIRPRQARTRRRPEARRPIAGAMCFTLVLGAVLALLVGSASTAADGPLDKPDRSYISISGTVASSAPDRFTLDYGDGLVTVEMDDWDWYDEARHIDGGDHVTVYGRVDRNLYANRTIEASAVYVDEHGTFYYANDADEESVGLAYAPPNTLTPSDGTRMHVTGTVTRIDGREFVLDTGYSKVRVDTLGLGYNPLDSIGLQRIEKNDRVSVTGNLDLDFFERAEIQADVVTKLSRDATRKNDA
jgi:uncharacterized protein YdeI (BOF family)